MVNIIGQFHSQFLLISVTIVMALGQTLKTKLLKYPHNYLVMMWFSTCPEPWVKMSQVISMLKAKQEGSLCVSTGLEVYTIAGLCLQDSSGFS